MKIFCRDYLNDGKQLSEEVIDSAQTEGQICPRCGNKMVLRNGKYGRFWGCEGFKSNDIRFAFQLLGLPGIEDSPDQLVGFCLLSTQSNPCGQLPVARGAKKGPGHTGQINRALHNPLQVHAQQPAAACFLVEGEISFAITAGYHDQAAASNLFATGILVNQSITPWIARTGLCGNFLLPERRWPFLPTLLVVLIGCHHPAALSASAGNIFPWFLSKS